MRLEDLGLIGNCQFSALVEKTGAVVWCCLPRFDSEPVFGSILDPEGGTATIAPAGGESGVQSYVPNTNVLETTFTTKAGAFRVIDFAPRFFQYDRSFRPTMLVRIVEPLSGRPFVRVTCEPRLGWSKKQPVRVHGSNHVRFEGFDGPLRLTTDVPLSHVEGAAPFALAGRQHLVLSWGAPVEEPLPALCDRFLSETIRYWQRWVKHTNVPSLFQHEAIRSALTLKLHCFEDTGAIIAATTTSIPEAPGSGRTWDYRYCWLRDAYYVLSAFRRLGHFEERERFVNYLLDIVGRSPDLDLAPLYRVDGTSDLEERTVAGWRGFEGHGPVRVGNEAAQHRQNDVFGEMVLALAPVFLDERFREEATENTLDVVQRLARKAISVAGTPDAGIWEHRNRWTPQTFSSVMCWAAADRMALLAKRRGRPELAAELESAAERIHTEIELNTWSEPLGAFVSSYGGAELDASLLQIAKLRFLGPDDPRTSRHIDAIWKGLAKEGWLFRYQSDDGFGIPSVAFVFCTFWLVEALAATDRLDEAQSVFEAARGALSPLGLLSEDFDAGTRRLWGNFPQAYSHVGLIHSAYAASPRWSDVL